MSQATYSTTLILISCLLLYFGLHLSTTKIPDKLKSSVYDKARKLMGVAFATISLSIIIFFVFNIHVFPPYVRTAYNLWFYYVISKLISASFVTLIGSKHKIRDLRHKWSLVWYIVYPILIWSTLFINDPATRQHSQILAAIILFISIVREITYFFRRYNDVIKQGEFFYAEGIGIHINWMIQCVYAFISVGIFSVIMAFSTHFPTWALFCYMISFIAVCIYIFNSYLNFMVIFSKLVDKETEAELIPRINTTPKSQLSPEVQQYIQAQIEEWIKAKGYCEDDVSLQSVSMKIYSNRQYLSSYINTTYQCSFRIWISKLRLEDAKEMLLNNPDMTITTIATKVGFQSLTSFTHAFTSIEGISPRKWAQTNRHHIKS